MKYIRTKDKIMAFANLPYNADSEGNQGYKGMKITDTIEELCDVEVEFNHRYKQGKEPISLREPCNCKYCQEEKIACLKKGDNWFGAIWTDKGLIYVAKMNEKGELELL